nr:FtsX-like permease family protein [Lentimicrobiaceae bacterium]
GLFGMVSYIADQRTREIDLQKVLGASRCHIFELLSREMNYLILVSVVISFPVTWLLVRNWLDHFTVQIPLDWKVFVLAGLFALLIANLVSVYKAFSSYRVNPVDTLKYE